MSNPHVIPSQLPTEPNIPRQRTGDGRELRPGAAMVAGVSTDELRSLVAALVADALTTLDTAERTTPLIPEPGGGSGHRARRTPSSTGRLTLDEVCADLRISRSTFYDWRAKGKAPRCIKLPNGELRINRAEFEHWLSEREDAA